VHEWVLAGRKNNEAAKRTARLIFHELFKRGVDLDAQTTGTGANRLRTPLGGTALYLGRNDPLVVFELLSAGANCSIADSSMFFN